MTITEPVLRSLPEVGIDFPSNPLMNAAFEYAQKYCPEGVNNHVARCAYWALILAKKLPEYNSVSPAQTLSRPVDVEDVVLICLLHDLGLASWIFESDDRDDRDDRDATTRASTNPLPGLLSLDKRFEVDCANIARAFVQAETQKTNTNKNEALPPLLPWDEARLDRLWMAIALHSNPSIARHAPAPEVALAQMAIEADFLGPYWAPSPSGHGSPQPSGGPESVHVEPIITVEEYRAVAALFPRGDFDRAGVTRKMCALCRRKPDTTYDNFVGLFGKEYGCEGGAAGREEYLRSWEARQSPEFLLQALDSLAALDSVSATK